MADDDVITGKPLADGLVAHVWLGNPAPVDWRKLYEPDGEPQLHPDTGEHLKQRIPSPHSTWTEVGVVLGQTVRGLITDIAAADGLWKYHSDAEGPSWIASDDPALARALAAFFSCPTADIPADALGVRAS